MTDVAQMPLHMPVTFDANGERVYRHALPVRIFHWINALCFTVLLISGWAIFNAHPRLYWGHIGFSTIGSCCTTWPSIFSIEWERDPSIRDAPNPNAVYPKSWIAINDKPAIPTTGLFGQGARRAFPTWLTMNMNLARARGWHFMALWLFAANLIGYLIYGLASGRFKRTLVPDRDQVKPRAVLHDLWMHLRLKRAHGAEAARYNLLQKLSYIVVLFVLLPIMVLSGLSQSPSMLSRFPWLIDLFGGRQTARTFHFACANLLFLFLLVHLFQLFVAGVVNEVRSMITGWFQVSEAKK